MIPPRSSLFAGLVLVLMLVGPAVSADASNGLRCSVTWGASGPTVSVYRLEREAGRVSEVDGAFYTTAGATQRSERMTIVRTIESWTDDELILRSEHRSNDGLRTATIRDLIDLKRRTITVLTSQTSPTLKLSPSEYKGTCEPVALDAAPAKG